MWQNILKIVYLKGGLYTYSCTFNTHHNWEMQLVYDYLCKGKASCIFPVISYNMSPDWRLEALVRVRSHVGYSIAVSK